jgi:hypothetical protein
MCKLDIHEGPRHGHVQGTVDRAGRLRPGPAGHIPVRHGTVRLTMPAGSALILTFDDCA